MPSLAHLVQGMSPVLVHFDFVKKKTTVNSIIFF